MFGSSRTIIAVVSCGLVGIATLLQPAVGVGVEKSAVTTRTWSPRVFVSGEGVIARGPEVAVDGVGVASVVFERRRNYIQVVRRSTTGTWSAPKVIGRGNSPRIGVDDAGRVTVVWLGGDGRLRSSRRALNGVWSSPVTIAAGAGSGRFDLAVSSGGAAAVVWVRYVKGVLDEKVLSAYRPPSGPWLAPQRVGLSADIGNSNVELAIDAAGNAVAVYGDGDTSLVAARRTVQGGGWTTPTVITGPEDDESFSAYFDVAVDPEGNIVAVWMQIFDSQTVADELRSTRRPVGGPWEPPAAIPADPGPYIQVAMDSSGRATAVWDTRLSGGVEASDRSGAASWDPATTIAEPVTDYASDVELAMSDSGATVVTYLRGFTEPERSELQAVYRDDAGVWSTPQALSSQYTYWRDQEVSPDGDVVVVWQTDPPGSGSRIAARVYSD